MSYTLKTECGQEAIADGKWVGQMTVEIHNSPPEYPVGRRDPDAEVIGVNKNDYWLHSTATKSYRNATGCWSQIRTVAVVSRFPFAVLTRHMVGTEFELADICPARQIHNGELGRYPELPNLPRVCHQITGQNGKMLKFVSWAEVAQAYGETDFWKLWQATMPLAPGFDFYVTYQETTEMARVCYPRPVNGVELTHTSTEFSSRHTPDRVEEYIAKHCDPSNTETVDRLRARMNDMYQRHLSGHLDWLRNTREHKTIPRDLLWDDPIIDLDHLCVPLGFARSVLLARRFGLILPNVKKAEKNS